MKSNDIRNKGREEARSALQQALRQNDPEAFSQAFEQLLDSINADFEQVFNERLDKLEQERDSAILATRGVRQLTSEEKKFYQALADAMLAKNPKQALENLGAILPSTTYNSVFDELETRHPLLSRIDFVNSGASVKFIMDTNGMQRAQWGELCDAIVKEITAGFTVVDTNLLKLSAFIPVCKQALSLGPEWLERYIREILYEAISNGLEYGIVTGNGSDEPIGMDRQFGPGVTVTDGEYPQKAVIKVESFDADTLGNLLSLLAIDGSGKPRVLREVVMLVNPADYYSKVFGATHIMGLDGVYRNAMPFAVEIIQTAALMPGEAILGLPYRYFAAVGNDPDGVITFSDHAMFLSDKRVYLIKLFATGMPKDGGSFIRLDITGLKPPYFRFENVTPTPSNDATLAGLKIGALALSPAFAAATTSYEAATTNATNTITATPADASAEVEVLVNDVAIQNGTAAEWVNGENTVTVNVTAADGTTTKAYTVTVTATLTPGGS